MDYKEFSLNSAGFPRTFIHRSGNLENQPEEITLFAGSPRTLRGPRPPQPKAGAGQTERTLRKRELSNGDSRPRRRSCFMKEMAALRSSFSVLPSRCFVRRAAWKGDVLRHKSACNSNILQPVVRATNAFLEAQVSSPTSG